MEYKEVSTFIMNNNRLIGILCNIKDNYKIERKNISIILELIDNDLIHYVTYEYTYKFLVNLHFDIKYKYDFYYNELYLNNSLNKIIDRLELIENNLRDNKQ